jgi:hypothetical protein
VIQQYPLLSRNKGNTERERERERERSIITIILKQRVAGHRGRDEAIRGNCCLRPAWVKN